MLNSRSRTVKTSDIPLHTRNGSDICKGIITLYKTARYYGPIYAFDIEDTNGSSNLGDLLTRIAQEMGVRDFYCPQLASTDNAANAKNSRIAILASAMKNREVMGA